MKTEKSEFVCAVCGDPLTVKTTKEYRGDPMHMIAGPGSRNQMTTVVDTYCDACGIQYVTGGGLAREKWAQRRELDRLAEVARKIRVR